MNAPDWRSLVVSVNDRSAIFAEHFPGVLRDAGDDVITWFSDEQARQILFTFAGAWPSLARESNDSSLRYIYVSDGNFVCRFRGVQIATSTIVIDEVTVL